MMGLLFLNSRGGFVDIEDLKGGLILSTSVESKVGADPEAMLVEAVCYIVMTKLESSEL